MKQLEALIGQKDQLLLRIFQITLLNNSLLRKTGLDNLPDLI